MLKNLLYFAIFTTLIVSSWVVFGIYHSSVTSTITPDTTLIITPIPSSFDTKTINNIKTRQIIPADISLARSGGVASKSGTPSINIPSPTSVIVNNSTPSAAL